MEYKRWIPFFMCSRFVKWVGYHLTIYDFIINIYASNLTKHILEPTKMLSLFAFHEDDLNYNIYNNSNDYTFSFKYHVQLKHWTTLSNKEVILICKKLILLP